MKKDRTRASAPWARRAWLRGALALAGGVVMRHGGAAERSLKIGLSLPLSDSAGNGGIASRTDIVPDIGLDYLAGFNAALARERRGVTLEAVALDDGGDPAVARANAQQLERQGVVAMSGGWSTGHVRAMLPELERAGLPLVGMRSGAPELRTGQFATLYHLRAGWDDEVDVLSGTMLRAGCSRLGVLHGGDELGKRVLALLEHSRVTLAKAQAVVGPEQARDAARAIASSPDVQALVLLSPVDTLAPLMTSLRKGGTPFLAPISALSHVLCDRLAAARDPVYQGIAVTCPFPNPLHSRLEVARRFRDAMTDAGLDHAQRSFSGFEGYVAGSVLARAVAATHGNATRETVARALQDTPFDLGGVRIEFDHRRVGYRRVSYLYKSPVDGSFRS